MTISIEIPKEFEEHITYDKFQDSLNRIYGELESNEGHYILAGKFELELIDMLRKSFNSAKVVQPLESLIITKENQ